MQVFQHRLHKLSARALCIQIFISKDQPTATLCGPLRRNPESSRMADVQQTGR